VNRYTLLELDDGGGAIITVKITRLPPELVNPVESPSNTTVSNVDIVAEPGRYEVLVDKMPLDIGTVVKVKCTISVFRHLRQLELKRIWILKSTAEEIAEWEEGAKFKREVMHQPWILSKERLMELQKAEVETRKKREEAERREEKRLRYEVVAKARRLERRRDHEERKEAKRRKEEDLMNAGAII
jgi:hypothetical protein